MNQPAYGNDRQQTYPALAYALTQPECQIVTCLMLDCAGFFVSLANKILLSAPLLSKKHIAVWDKFLVPISRIFDRGLG